MAGHTPHNLHVGKFEASQKMKTLAFALIAIGVLTFVVGLMKNQERMWPAYLIAFFYFACLGVAGLVWSALQNIAKAGWSVSIRRYAEATTSFIPATIIGALVLAAGFKYLYPWADPEVVASSKLIASKTGYLNTGFTVVRLLAYTIMTLIFAKLIVGNSLKQDANGDESYTHKNVGLSIAFILIFALLFTLFSMDLLMSLLPTWYSTIFGIYGFAGLLQSFFAFFAIVIILMKRSGLVKGYVTEEHLHDVVKFEKGFTVFWAYIAFSQFMLIWYANIPEETEYYIMRAQNGWMGVSIALLVFRFIVPFLALLPRGAKRNESHVLAVSVLILIMQYVDIFWMVMPNFNHGHFTFGFWEVGMFAGFAGIFLLGLFNFWSKHGLVAQKDPRMHEALSHHVAY
ncbi:MAG: molybdopterin oxidoreductase [Bdellovibrionia bacterium]